MAKSILDELSGYRVKVEKDGKEVVNIPGILALPGLLAAPAMSVIGMIAAPALGCSVHVEKEDGAEADLGAKVREAAESIADAAAKTARTIEEEFNKAWESMAADDSEEADESGDAEETAGDAAEEPEKRDEGPSPTIEVKPDDTTEA